MFGLFIKDEEKFSLVCEIEFHTLDNCFEVLSIEMVSTRQGSTTSGFAKVKKEKLGKTYED